MNKYEEIAANIIDNVIDMVHEQHPDIKCQTDDEGTELSLIYGDGYYTLEQEIAEKIKVFDDAELEMMSFRMINDPNQCTHKHEMCDKCNWDRCEHLINKINSMRYKDE